MKTEKKIQLEVGDKLQFFVRERRQRKLGSKSKGDFLMFGNMPIRSLVLA